MVIANLVGFAIGLDGIKLLLAQIFRPHSIKIFQLVSTSLLDVIFVVLYFVTLFAIAQIMFEIRESEARSGHPKSY